MKKRTMWMVVIVLVVLALMAGMAAALTDPLSEPQGINAEVAEKIRYRGFVTDTAGVPLDGPQTMRFQVWSAATGGTQWWDSGSLSVPVSEGEFTVDLPIYQPIFSGAELWLRIQVNTDWLSPRQELLAVPYAMGLRPGSEMRSNSQAGYGLNVNWTNTAATGGAIKGASATSAALFGYSTGGYGVYGYSDDNYAVYGYDGGSTPGLGHGGYFKSDNGTGVYGLSRASTVANNNIYFVGVHGHSDHGVGVMATNDDALPAMRAVAEGTGYGARVLSKSNYGIYADTWRGDNNYGLYTPDNIWANAYTALSSSMQVAQNSGSQSLERGDVVEFSGIGTALEEGGSPVVQVSKSASASSTAVAGVVHGRLDAGVLAGEPPPEGPQAEASDGPVAPGEYLLVVIQGPAQVKADAVSGSIQPGSLLSTAAQAGHAAAATQVEIQGIPLVPPGTVLGKALEPLADGQELIYIFVTLQ